MVKLYIKRSDEISQFLYEISAVISIRELTEILTTIYNGRLKIERICKEIELLCKHGIALPPNKQDEQATDEHDESSSKCEPHSDKKPEVRRGGKAPADKMVTMLSKVVEEAMGAISNQCAFREVCVTRTKITEILEMLRDVMSVVFPMGLPPYDPIQQEFENNESLDQPSNVISISDAQLWWAGKPLQSDKMLSDYIGKNEKTSIVVKLQRKDQGPTGSNVGPRISLEEQNRIMLEAYKRQETLKNLQDDDDDTYLNAQWADRQTLKKSLHGVDSISWKPF